MTVTRAPHPSQVSRTLREAGFAKASAYSVWGRDQEGFSVSARYEYGRRGPEFPDGKRLIGATVMWSEPYNKPTAEMAEVLRRAGFAAEVTHRGSSIEVADPANLLKVNL